jgi:hypothetical protein
VVGPRGQGPLARRSQAGPRRRGLGGRLPRAGRHRTLLARAPAADSEGPPPGGPRAAPPPALQPLSPWPATAPSLAGMRVVLGASAAGGAAAAYRATTIPRAYRVPLARFSAVLRGPGAGGSNGAIDEAGSGSAVSGTSARRASIASREHDRGSRRPNDGGGSHEDTAVHRGGEYNRGTGCGTTARPGLHGGAGEPAFLP